MISQSTNKSPSIAKSEGLSFVQSLDSLGNVRYIKGVENKQTNREKTQMTNQQFQEFSNIAPLLRGYGATHGWRTALVSPSGDIVAVQRMGSAPSTTTMQLVFGAIEQYLLSDECHWTDCQLVGSSVSQMLGLEALKAWHNYRLAWGNDNPGMPHGQWSNGRDLQWTLYYISNGQKDIVMNGVLPEGWWEMDSDEQDRYLENN